MNITKAEAEQALSRIENERMHPDDEERCTEVLRAFIAQAGEDAKPDRLRLGDLFTHQRSGAQFACRSVTYSADLDGQTRTYAAIVAWPAAVAPTQLGDRS